jgi:aerobic C4-dicarboxylate transport protein
MRYIKKLITNLTFWVLLAITIGILLGHYSPATAMQLEPLSRYFIQVVKLFINPLIFLTIVLGIAGMGNLKKVGKVGAKALLYFEVVTTLALLVGIGVAYLIKPGKGVIFTRSGADVSAYTKSAEAFSWWGFLKENATLQVLLVSIIIGILLNLYGKKERIISVLQRISKYVFRALHWVMIAAPIGALGGMAFTVGKYGLHTLLPLAKLMLTVYCTMAVFIFGVLWALLRYYKISIYRFLNYIKEEILIVLGTSSSEAALPALMEKLEKMGCSKPVVGLVVPAGYSFNLDGTTIYLSMATLFLAQVFGVELTFSQMLTIIGVLMVTSKGAAGVTGSGFVILASTLSAVKVVPVEGLALLLGVDRFMSEARAITNFIGNGVATVFLANNEKEFDREQMTKAFSKETHELQLNEINKVDT